MKNKLLILIKKNHKKLHRFFEFYNYFLSGNKFSIGKNKMKIGSSILNHCKIIISGEGNRIIIGDKVRFSNCIFYIKGDNNTIKIEDNGFFNSCEFHIEDSSNNILVGENTTVQGKTHLAAIEGTKIEIGNDCMFSRDIDFRTGDSHSIITINGERINPSKDIVIGNHVWVGTQTICLKGATISSNSIIAAGSIVTKPFLQENIIIGGNPAKVLKTEINWLRERI